MALAVGNRVFLNTYGLPSGLMSDPPLLGKVDMIDGTGNDGEDLVRVAWDNGAFSYFQSTDETQVGLSIVTAISVSDAGELDTAFGYDGVILLSLTVSATVYNLVYIDRISLAGSSGATVSRRLDKYALVAA